MRLVFVALIFCLLTFDPLSAATGTAIWRSGSSTTPKFSEWDGSSFGADDNTVDVGDFRIFAGAEAPTRDEKLIVGVDNSSDVAGMIWDGSGWSAFPFNPISTVSQSYWWGFDIAYESQSGDAVVVANNGSSGTLGISAYTWDGSIWAKDTISTPLSGEPMQMRIAANPNFDEMVLIVSNENSQDYAIVWDGSNWGDSQVLDNSGSGDDRTDIYVAYEQQSGHAMVTYGKGTEYVFFRLWDGSVWSSEDSVAGPGDASGNVQWTTLDADPSSDRIILGVLTNNTDVWLNVWNGSAWETSETATNSATGTNHPCIAVAFECQSGEALGVYGESNGIRYRTWDSADGWSGENSTPDVGTATNSLMLDAAPNSNEIMLSVQDDNNDLNCLFWDGDSWGTPDELETNTDDTKNQPFIFLWENLDPKAYYVAPTGDDGNDGSDSANAWLTIDNGDQLGVLRPGDTVFVLEGTYNVTSSVTMTISGFAEFTINYINYNSDSVVIDGGDATNPVVEIAGNYTVFDGFEVKRSTSDGIKVTGSNNVITNCFVHTHGRDGIRVEESDCLVYRNIVRHVDDHGIHGRDGGPNLKIYNNTIYSCLKSGIEFQSDASLAHTINNIVFLNDDGIKGKIENICAFNNVWNNTNNDYADEVVDSAGGISADPLLTDTIAGDFSLQPGSPCIDSGLDIGYSFEGDAPDMGAIEYISPGNQLPVLAAIGPQSTTENVNLNFVISATDIESTPSLTTSTLPTGASFLDNGDGTGTFDWTPTYLQSGDHYVTFYATDDSSAVDSEVVTVTVNEAGNQLPVLAAIGPQSTTENVNLNFVISATDIESTPSLTTSTLPTGASFLDNGDGTGTFDWTPTYLQSGDHYVTFYATDDSSAVDSEIVSITVNNTFGHFYVSPTGDDDSSGLDSANAWASIDNGDQKGLLGPGDTINILPGTYNITDSIHLTTSGSLTQKITYRKTGENPAIIDGSEASGNASIIVRGSYTIVDGLELINADWDGIEVHGNSNIITNCYVHHCTADGIDIGGADGDVDGSLVYRNIITHCGESGLENDSTATNSLFYSNTCAFNTANGIWLKESSPTARVFNNIFSDNGLYGIDGAAGNVCGFNDVWNNSSGNYDGGVADSAGGLSADPLFADAASGDFSLLPVSPLIDKGLDLGYPFNGLAPDMGADETGNHLPVLASINSKNVVENNNLTFAVSASDAESVPILTTSALPPGATFADSGDGTGIFDWTPMYPSAGDYDIIFYATDDSSAVDSEVVTITVNDAVLDYIVVTPDSVVVSADSTQQFTVTGYDSGSNEANPGDITWSLTTVLGLIDSTGLFDATTVGMGQVVAISDLGPVDSSLYLEVISGEVDSLYISPHRDTISADSTRQFTVTGYDSEGNETTDIGNITWGVLRGIGKIDSTGLFTPVKADFGFITANSDLLPGYVSTDTIFIIPGEMAYLEITPDSIDVRFGDSVQFTALGYDADSNIVDAGTITWAALGRCGNIDSTGLFISTLPGRAKVSAVSSVGGMADTTGFIDVEELYLTTVSLGNETVYPNHNDRVLLTFRIDNYFDTDKALEAITLYDASSGSGDIEERLTNLDSLYLYYDIDNDSLLTESDSLIGSREYNDDSLAFSFSPITIESYASRTFITAVKTALYPRDGDTIDLLLLTQRDILTSDSSIVIGPDTANSFGVTTIDGMTAGQITQVPTGTIEIISSADSIYNVYTVDIPRNGYRNDTLNIFSVYNYGTASVSDIDSFILFSDDGNGVWDGSDTETHLGALVYTGSRWIRSGLNVALADQNNRFYVGAALATYPANNTTLALAIPENGLEMSSENDGPIDAACTPYDTITIHTTETVDAECYSLSSRMLTPGDNSGPLLTIRLVNSYIDTLNLDSIHLNIDAVDPDGATQTQLDNQFDSLLLYINRDEDYSTISSADSLIATVLIQNGAVVFNTGGLTIEGGGGELELVGEAKLNQYNCKNDNLLRLEVTDSTAFYFDQSIDFAGEFPLVNAEYFVIKNFSAGNVVVNDIGNTIVYGGQINKTALDFILPNNGYINDSLTSLRIVNSGTLQESSSLLNLKLWADKTNNGFSVDDSLLGSFTVIDDYWRITNLNYPIGASGTRFIITIDVSNSQFEAATVNLSIPIGGVVYRSTTDGPDDNIVSNSIAMMVFPSNRITIISVPAASSIVRAQQSNVNIMSFAFYNGYLSQSQTINGLSFSNISHSHSDMDCADYEIGQVSLYYDFDRDRIFEEGHDSLVGVGSFNDGRLQFTGFDVTLPAESLSYFFALSDFPQALIDSDSLAVSIASPSDFSFEGTVNVNGDLPLITGGYLVVDGSIAEQYEIIETLPRTLRPGDSSITLFAFKPAYNGWLTDTLNSLTIQNTGTADSSDFSSHELWLDINDDDTWQSDDSLIGAFEYINDQWVISTLELSIDSNRISLFVLGDVSASATPGATFMGRIPTNGCLYNSDNDGPIDSPLDAAGSFTISVAGLQIANQALQESFTVGQTIALGIDVTNIQGSSIDNVYGSLCEISDSNLVAFDSSQAGPVTLAAGETADFVFYYTAAAAGELYWRVLSYSESSGDSSAILQTSHTRIQESVSDVSVQILNSMPISVTRGQSNVFPLSIGYIHPDSTLAKASLKIDSITIGVENSSGLALYADDVFSRIKLGTEYSNLVVLQTIPHASEVVLNFSQSIYIAPDDEQYLSLLVDIDSTATADNFVLTINETDDIPVSDKNTGLPVTIVPEVDLPFKTASCRIDDASEKMVVSSLSLLNNNVNYGQDNVDVLQLKFRHPSSNGSSQIRLTDMSLLFIDEYNDTLVVSELLDCVRLLRQQTIVAEIDEFTPSAKQLDIQSTSLLAISGGETDSLVVQVSIKDDATTNNFALFIPDSTSFIVRDGSSGSPLTLATDTVYTLATGSEFPIMSSLATLKAPAVSPEICLASLLPISIAGGVDSLNLLALSINYSAAVGTAPIKLDNIFITVFDSSGTPLDPDRLFDRIGYHLGDGAIEYQPYVELSSGRVVFDIDTNGYVFNPGDSETIYLAADIENDVPFDNFVLEISSPGEIAIYDYNDTTHTPGFALDDYCSAEIPFITEKTQVFLPAARPLLTIQSLPTQIAFPGQQGAVLIKAGLDYNTGGLQGDLEFESVTGQILRRTADGIYPVPGNTVFNAIYVVAYDQIIVIDTILEADTLRLVPPGSVPIPNGTTVEVTILCDLRDDAPNGNYLLSFNDSTFLDLSDMNLSTIVYPILTGTDFPLNSVDISVVAPSLENSFTNYPNPFNPSRGVATTIGYVLPEDATVDIDIYTITGEKIKEVVSGGFRTSGPHQEDSWSGDNMSGRGVIPGTYFCQITARYTSGKTESFRRKIAVIR